MLELQKTLNKKLPIREKSDAWVRNVCSSPKAPQIARGPTFWPDAAMAASSLARKSLT